MRPCMCDMNVWVNQWWLKGVNKRENDNYKVENNNIIVIEIVMLIVIQSRTNTKIREINTHTFQLSFIILNKFVCTFVCTYIHMLLMMYNWNFFFCHTQLNSIHLLLYNLFVILNKFILILIIMICWWNSHFHKYFHTYSCTYVCIYVSL